MASWKNHGIGQEQRKVRSVHLKLANKSSISRPLRLLYPLEMGPSREMTPTVADGPAVDGDATIPYIAQDDDNISEAESGFSLGEVQEAQERLQRLNVAESDLHDMPLGSTLGPGGSVADQ